MSEDINEDSWLYGTENTDIKDSNEKENDLENAETVDENNDSNIDKVEGKEETTENVDSNQQKQVSIEDDPAMEMEEQEESQMTIHISGEETENLANGKSKGTDEDYSEDDSDDDDINIVINSIKTGPVYTKQRQNFLVPNVVCQTEKKPTSGKFSIEEFESMGSINGVSVHEFSIDSLDEKPWRKPGADITDYFNYGFNEDTWRAYCERQKRIRINESGVGLQALTAALSGMPNPQPNTYNQQQGQTPQVISSTGFMSNNRTLTPVSNTDKYSGQMRSRNSFPPSQQLARENAIQVMTAECRDYSKMNFAGGHDDSFFENDGYNYGFEPTQDLQWLNQVNKSWQPTGIKELTLDPGLVGPPAEMSNHSAPEMGQHPMMNIPQPTGMTPSTTIPRPIESLMLPPKVAPPFPNRDWNKDWERDKDMHYKDREREIRSRDKDRIRESRDRDSIIERERSDRDRSDREYNRERERTDDKKRSRDKSRERNKEKSEESDESREKRRRDRGRERDRDRERSSRRDSSRTREKSKRRSKSHEKSSDRKEKRDKKKVKEKNGSE
ncbi:pre-mRNA 3'-end-processing factor FIP1 [Condylostylus longicornis]|uniref:pre-mRNA 3'-end-processing factor FIP1 n=1 Tax=Condylostylus longicornis TaxID=2530218 RepID=UPI00244D9DA5|nr:pre-mRNA 3'-end-processing factor FIP1 [Condylostylus longicornis]